MEEVLVPEYRRNSPFGHWRLFSNARNRRPIRPDTCPLCPGYESENEKTLLQIPEHGEWEVRVVPNKYPFLMIEGRPFRHDGELDIRARGPWQRLDGTGAHEVIIESRRHDAKFHEFSVAEVSDTLFAACARYHDLKGDRRMNFFFLFRNTGYQAGMSILHPHWQIKASVVIPEGAAEILNEYRRYHMIGGKCLYCDHLDEVRQDNGGDNSLFVSENDSCTAFVPYAPEFLNEVWIVPKKEWCNCSFAYQIRDREAFRRDIAHMLLGVTRRLAMLCNGSRPSLLNYNIVFHTAPYFDDSKNGVFHWHIRVLPQGFTMDGSVERATKLRILPAFPEAWARALRALELQNADIR